MLLKYEDSGSVTHRPKCSLLLVVNNFFGITLEKDLHVIKMALGKLANTQGQIVYVIEDSAPVINVAKSEVIDNRCKINKLISNLKSIVGSTVNAMQGLEKRLSKMEILTHGYWLYKIMVDRLRKYFLDICMALSFQELQFNLLSVGH